MLKRYPKTTRGFIRRFPDTCQDARDWLKTQPDMATAWDSCHRVDWMLWALGKIGYSDERELRLFACWCVRQVWHLLTNERSRRAVEVAERYAVGQASYEELSAAWSAALSAALSAADAAKSAADAARSTAKSAAWRAADAALSAAWSAADAARSTAKSTAWSAADAARSTAWSAADAARSTAWSAALSAADAARSTAWSAAWSAAWSTQADELRRRIQNPWRSAAKTTAV